MKLLTLIFFISTTCLAQAYPDNSQWKFEIIQKAIDSVSSIEQINLSDTNFRTGNEILIDYRDNRLAVGGDLLGWTLKKDYQRPYLDSLLRKKIVDRYEMNHNDIYCEECFDQRFGLVTNLTTSLPITMKGIGDRELDHCRKILVDLPLYMEWTPVHILHFLTVVTEDDNRQEWIIKDKLTRYKAYQLYLPVSVVKNDLVKGRWINACHQYLAEITLSADDSFSHFKFDLTKLTLLNKW